MEKTAARTEGRQGLTGMSPQLQQKNIYFQSTLFSVKDQELRKGDEA